MAVLRGAAGWIIRQAAAMQAAGGRRWRACPSRLAALAAGAAAVRSGKAGRLWALCRWGRAGAGAWSSCAAVCCWRGHLVRRWRCRSFPVQVAAGAICCGRGALAWSSGGGTTPSACRAADPAGRAGGRREGGVKEKGQGGGAWCAAALAFCLHWRCDLLRRVRPGAYRGRRGLLPVPVPFRCCWHWSSVNSSGCNGSGWRCSIRSVFGVCRRGQILHLTG